MRQTTVRFLKKMPCSEVVEAEKLLSQLFPGFVSEDVERRTKLQVEKLNLKNENATCISGVEFNVNFCKNARCKRRAAKKDDTIIIIIIKEDTK